MLKKSAILAAVVVLILFAGWFFLRVDNASKNPDEILQPIEVKVSPFAPFTAHFEIYTLGTKRTFSQAMYHNLDENVFIPSSSPEEVQVMVEGISWNDFFSTLPFELTPECLLTGTGQKFCNDEVHKLSFYLNDQENPTILQQDIEPQDKLVIRYQ